MYIEGKGNWLNHLDGALDKYYNRVHGTTKMTPFKASNNSLISSNINNNVNKYPNFKWEILKSF